MKFKHFFYLLIVWAGFVSFQTKLTMTKAGWLIYRYGENVAFFPIKDQRKVPTYANFLTEEKEDGERMNGNYSAPPKLLIAKQMTLSVSDGAGKPLRKLKFYIQPVKYVYQVNNELSDTTNPEMNAGGWIFQLNGKMIVHPVYHPWERSGSIHYLTKEDSIFAQKGGRRKNIKIYPPH